MKNSKRSKDELLLSSPNFARRLGRVELETLPILLERHGIQSWDILLVGDGSGGDWDNPCGWASVSIERAPLTGNLEPERRCWHGGMNFGTVNVAEIMAYVQPLNWFVAREEERHRKGRRRAVHQVHIFTDSQYCRDMGGSADRQITKNGVFWSAFDTFARQGFLLYWHWIRRDDVALNVYADLLSKMSRGLFKKHDLRTRLENEIERTLHDCNPS